MHLEGLGVKIRAKLALLEKKDEYDFDALFGEKDVPTKNEPATNELANNEPVTDEIADKKPASNDKSPKLSSYDHKNDIYPTNFSLETIL